jgi:glyoxylase-like metal-dependent hydrolase (beta-lactamase superfamily II)
MSVLAFAFAGQNAPVPVDSLRIFTLEGMGPGVYAALVLPRPDAAAFANSMIVVGEEGVLVVDTQASPSAAAALVRRVQALSDTPVRWVVNTHWHSDHVNGNQAWADAYPDVRFLAHPATVAGMRGEGATRRAEELATLPTSIDERRRWLEEGTGPDGAPLSTTQRDDLAYSLRLRSAYLDELRALRLVYPDGVVEDRMTLDLGGGRTVELIHPGPAHTRGDLVVWVPDAGALAAGDLLEDAAPWIEGADLAGWAEALERLQQLDGVRAVLPAHGGVRTDRERLDDTQALFRAVVDAGRAARREGWTPADAVQRLDLGAQRAFLASLGLGEEAIETFLTDAVAQAADGAGEADEAGPAI